MINNASVRVDLYRALVNKHGKAKVWSMNPEQVCEAIEEILDEECVVYGC